MALANLKERAASIGDNLAAAGPVWRWAIAVVLVYLLVTVLLGIYWSIAPSRFDVREQAAEQAAASGGRVVTGSTTTSAVIGVMRTLLEKPGGYLRNDRFPPGLWLDNIPSWEYGALVQVRDLARVLRESYSRSQSQSTEDPDLSQAEPLFHFTASSWILPSSESQYRRGLRFMESYSRRLADQSVLDAQFFARADNLAYWLGSVELRLGSLSQRLSASVGQRRLNTDLAGDAAATRSTEVPQDMIVRTPWYEIDDVFYEARGTTWALIHFLRAAEVDFAEVLQKKNATVSMEQIVRELEATQARIYSPVILNGTGFGFVANHSLVMASYISRANAAIIDLRRLLQDG
jgi:hypothetical protein